MNSSIKKFLNNPNYQNLIQKNDWKSILLGDILDDFYGTCGDFSVLEEFCQLMRDANIPIDLYFDKVFNQFEVKKHFPKVFFTMKKNGNRKLCSQLRKNSIQ